MNPLNLASIRPHSFDEGPGRRTVVFVSGCRLRCPHCHNAHLFERAAGHPVTIDDLLARIVDARDEGVSLLGGEPLDQPEGVALLCRALHTRGIHTIVYTGYVYERLLVRSPHEPALGDILDTADVLVDGPYVEALKDPNIQYRGSLNQRVIDLPRTRASGRLTLLDWDAEVKIIIHDGQISVPVCDATRPILHLLGEPITVRACGHLPPDELIRAEAGHRDTPPC